MFYTSLNKALIVLICQKHISRQTLDETEYEDCFCEYIAQIKMFCMT